MSPLSLGDKETVEPLRKFGCSFDIVRFRTVLECNIKKVCTKVHCSKKPFSLEYIRAWIRAMQHSGTLETWPPLPARETGE